MTSCDCYGACCHEDDGQDGACVYCEGPTYDGECNECDETESDE